MATNRVLSRQRIRSRMTSAEEPHKLLRKLGPWMAIAMVVGNVIGSGIFYKPGNIAAASGNFTLIISVWIVGGLLCVLGAMCFAELGTMFPHAGGIYVYLKHAYGTLTAFLFGWTEFILLRSCIHRCISRCFCRIVYDRDKMAGIRCHPMVPMSAH